MIVNENVRLKALMLHDKNNKSLGNIFLPEQRNISVGCIIVPKNQTRVFEVVEEIAPLVYKLVEVSKIPHHFKLIEDKLKNTSEKIQSDLTNLLKKK